jgi:predicted transcriptional regulator of viral defense system
MAVAKALSRLAKEGKIVRVKKGLYHFPKTTILGKTTPSPNETIISSKSGESLVHHPAGAAAAYNLGVTTQVPAEIVMVGATGHRSLLIDGVRVKLRRRDNRHLTSITEKEFFIIETMRNIRRIPGATSADAIPILKKEIKKADAEALTRAALKEPPRVRALLGAIFEDLKIDKELREKLKFSLNPLTSFKLEVGAELRSAKNWRMT